MCRMFAFEPGEVQRNRKHQGCETGVPQRERKQDAAGQELSRHVGMLAEANMLLEEHMALEQGHNLDSQRADKEK